MKGEEIIKNIELKENKISLDTLEEETNSDFTEINFDDLGKE